MRNAASPADLALALAKEFARGVAVHYEPALFEVTLFGPRARGDAGEESDLGLSVIL